MLYKRTGNAFTAWNGEPINGIQYPTNIEFMWSANQLAAITLYQAAPADAIPVGKYSTGQTVNVVGGIIKYVNILEDITPLMLTDKRATAYLAIVSQTNGLTSSILDSYPEGEKALWLAKEAEARAFIATAVGSRTTTQAPILSGVCDAQYGPTDDATLLGHITDKASAVIQKADIWHYVAAYVEGFRSKYDLLIDAAAYNDIDSILVTSQAEINATRAYLGL